MRWQPMELSRRTASSGLWNGCFFNVAGVPRGTAMVGSATGDAEQQADANQHQKKIRAAAADKRQRQALVRQRAGHDANIDERLQSDQKSQSGRQQQPERVARMPGNVNAANQQHDEGGEHAERGDQTEFFPDIREDEIGLM